MVLLEYHGLWRSWVLVYTHLAVIGEQNVGLRAPGSVHLMGEYSRTGRGLGEMAGLGGVWIWRSPQCCWLGVCGAKVRTLDHSSGQPCGPRRTSVASARSSLCGLPTPSHHDLDLKRHFAPLPRAPRSFQNSPRPATAQNRSGHQLRNTKRISLESCFKFKVQSFTT